MLVSLILARSVPLGVIARNGKIPWKLKADRIRFREITKDAPLIMGRKTYQADREWLKGHPNIVMSRKGFLSGNNCFDVTSPAGALEVAESTKAQEVFVVGGAQIYWGFIEEADKVYLTEVYDFESLLDDTTFSYSFPEDDWETEKELIIPRNQNNEYETRYRVLRRGKSFFGYDYWTP